MSFGLSKDASNESIEIVELPTCSGNCVQEITKYSNQKNWKKKSEKETFQNTVLVIYSYPQIVKYRRHNTAAIPKKCILNKILRSMSSSSSSSCSNISKDVQSKLSFLFNISMDSFRKTVTVNQPIQLAISSEAYTAPQPSMAIAEEPIAEMVITKEQAKILNAPQATENQIAIEIDQCELAATMGKDENSGSFCQIDFLDCSLPVKAKDSKTLINIIPSSGTCAPPASPVPSNHKLIQTTSTVDTKQKTTKAKTVNPLKQRQLELHRLRVEVEQKRLQLIALKLERERDEMQRERVLFEKDLEYKEAQLKQLRAESSSV